MTRPTLATLNERFADEYVSGDFVLRVEYRVGRYGLRVSRDGYGSRGNGGKLLHLVIATVIVGLTPSFDPLTYCSTEIKDQVRRMHAKSQHGKPGHYCHQPKVGDVLHANPVCVEQNTRGLGAFEPTTADTDLISCSNCLTRRFGETVEPRAKVEAREKAARAEAKAKNPPPTCPHCGIVRPRTKATERGERVMCGRCSDLAASVADYTYAAEHGKDRRYGYEISRDRAAELLSEHRAAFEKREGKHAGAGR